MLTQRMSKDACETWSHYHEEQGRADLQENMVIFENSLMVLLSGMPAAGVKAAPTDEIADELGPLLARWGGLKGNLETLVAGGALSMDQKVSAYAAYADRNH